ncbi:four helix bundle protein [Patescibacteria group bacterium]|nr:four helix bundle protein [Patescibacteria group bacterium]
MKFVKFEEIIAWKKAGELAYLIYEYFRDCNDYGFKNQVQRAGVSIMNNIAEGYERLGNKEFKNFLSIAKGSSGEVRSMFYLALKLGYINKQKFNTLNTKVIELSKTISGLIKIL